MTGASPRRSADAEVRADLLSVRDQHLRHIPSEVAEICDRETLSWDSDVVTLDLDFAAFGGTANQSG